MTVWYPSSRARRWIYALSWANNEEGKLISVKPKGVNGEKEVELISKTHHFVGTELGSVINSRLFRRGNLEYVLDRLGWTFFQILEKKEKFS